MTSGNRHTPTTRRARRVRTRARGATALGLAAVALVAFGGYILFMDGPSDAAGAVIPPGPAPSAPTIPDNARDLARLVEALRPLQHPLAEPGPHDWLTHHDEPGQSFEEYLACDPIAATTARPKIYILPIGPFKDTQFEVVRLTAEFMARYYQLPVEVQPTLIVKNLPRRAGRRHAMWGVTQLLTTYVLDEILTPRMPDDAAVYLALTARDLWPGPGWNFVFGQASLYERVGVWSIYRQGDPADSPEMFTLCLLRTLKIATHETGHMFSMQHCTAHACCMNGSNSREESDRNPLTMCNECVAKLCMATGADPVRRYRELASFCSEHGLPGYAKHYADLARLAAEITTSDLAPDAADRIHGEREPGTAANGR